MILAGQTLLAITSDGIGARVLARAGFRRDVAVRTLADGIGDRLHTLTDDDAEVLHTLGIDRDEVRQVLEAAFGDGALDRNDARRKAGRRPPFSADSERALGSAFREAIRLADRHIGTEPLLLGDVADDGSSAAAFAASSRSTRIASVGPLAGEISAGDPGSAASAGALPALPFERCAIHGTLSERWSTEQHASDRPGSGCARS